MSEFYEDETVLSEYLLFHYGEPEEIMPWDFGPKDSMHFPERVAHIHQSHYPTSIASSHGTLRALDIGCAVGRTTFELSRWFDDVVGIDYSHAFIKKANQLKNEGRLEYSYRIQGDQFQSTSCSTPPGARPEKITFSQGDAMDLPEKELGQFDLILASNLICRLPDPAKFLRNIPHLLKPGGVFVISTPFTYMDDFTEKSKWLGGTENGPKASDVVNHTLSEKLSFLAEENCAMLIREHERKYQWTVCQVSVWKH